MATEHSHTKLINKLIDNNVKLQKNNIELLHTMKELTTKVDKLVTIFDEASKHVLEVGEDKRILELTDKLGELLDQNKTIAKGLVMLEKYVRDRSEFQAPQKSPF
ncbi:hypothetical protein K8R47_01465 [archaeon]|nr:hypothetical protein [archaeon]